jgi:hypothetical protein
MRVYARSDQQCNTSLNHYKHGKGTFNAIGVSTYKHFLTWQVSRGCLDGTLSSSRRFSCAKTQLAWRYFSSSSHEHSGSQSRSSRQEKPLHIVSLVPSAAAMIGGLIRTIPLAAQCLYASRMCNSCSLGGWKTAPSMTI